MGITSVASRVATWFSRLTCASARWCTCVRSTCVSPAFTTCCPYGIHFIASSAVAGSICCCLATDRLTTTAAFITAGLTATAASDFSAGTTNAYCLAAELSCGLELAAASGATADRGCRKPSTSASPLNGSSLSAPTILDTASIGWISSSETVIASPRNTSVTSIATSLLATRDA